MRMIFHHGDSGPRNRSISFGPVLAMVLSPGLPAHSETLHGMHADVPCAACHTGEDMASPVPSATCVSCHGTMIDPLEEGEEISFPDPHRSPHLGPDDIPDCTVCHGVEEEPQVTCVRCHRGFEFEIERLGTPRKSGGE